MSEKKSPTQIIKKCDNVLPGQDYCICQRQSQISKEQIWTLLRKQNWRNVDKTRLDEVTWKWIQNSFVKNLCPNDL